MTNRREQARKAQEGRLIGALLRVPYYAVTRLVFQTLVDAGFDDFTYAHLIVFQNIDEKNGSRLTVLAQKSNMTKQSMGYLVTHLKECGYLEEIPDPKDGRAKRICLTERGMNLVRLAIATVRAIEAEWAQLIGQDQMDSLRQILKELVAILEANEDL